MKTNEIAKYEEEYNMATPVLNAELRTATGSINSTQARKAGKIPAVVYSRGADTKEILLDERETMRVLSRYGQNVRMGLSLEGEKSYVIIKDLQRGIVNNQKLIHVDLQTLDEREKIRMVMPVLLINREDVETSSKFVQLTVNELEIQTYPRYLPDRIELDASKLSEKEALTIADLNIGEDENIEISEEMDRVIATLTEAEDMIEEADLDTDEEAADVPEIGEETEEEEVTEDDEE